MTPTISSSVLFNLNTLNLTYADNTNYSSYGILISDVDGNLKCAGPTGIFYNHTNWSPPSIDLLSTNTIDIALPTSGGVVVSGTYTFDYTIRVNNQFTIVDASTSDQSFTISGNQTSIFSNGSSFAVIGGPNAGSYNVTSSAYDGTNTIIYTSQLISDSGPSGRIQIYMEYTNTQSFIFSDCAPVVVIDLTEDCDCSLITSMDLTNYTVNIDGTYYTPTTLNRVHTLNPPISPSTGNRVAGSRVTSDATIQYSPLWTSVWTATVVTTLTYNIGGLIVQKTASGSASLDVVCSDTLCCAYGCLNNLMLTYEEFKNNAVHKERWQNILIQALGWWMVYSVARSCGQTATAEQALTALLAVVQASGCACCPDNSAEPVQVIGLCGTVAGTGSGANVVVTTCGNGITVTPNTVGSTTTYQVCIDLDILNGYIANYLAANPLDLSQLGDVNFTALGSGNLLRYNGTKWVNVTSISISQLTEFNVSNPTVGQILRWNGSKWTNAANTGDLVAVEQNTYTSIGTSTQTVKTVALPIGTFATNGDLIDIETQWQVSADTNNKQIYLAVDGNDFIITAYLNATGIRRVVLNAQVIRVTSTKVRIEYYFRLYGSFGSYSYPDYGSTFYYADPTQYTINNMDTLASALQFRCVPTVGGSTISLLNYTVKSFKL